MRQASEQNCRGFACGITRIGFPHPRQNACASSDADTSTGCLRQCAFTLFTGNPVRDAIFLYPSPCCWRAIIVFISSVVIVSPHNTATGEGKTFMVFAFRDKKMTAHPEKIQMGCKRNGIQMSCVSAAVQVFWPTTPSHSAGLPGKSCFCRSMTPALVTGPKSPSTAMSGLMPRAKIMR